MFIERVNAFLDGVGSHVYDGAPVDRPPQVAPRPAPPAARAARGAALPEGGAGGHAAGARGRRWYGDYPVPRGRAPEDPAPGLPARPATSRSPRGSTTCAGTAARWSSRAGCSSPASARRSATRSGSRSRRCDRAACSACGSPADERRAPAHHADAPARRHRDRPAADERSRLVGVLGHARPTAAAPVRALARGDLGAVRHRAGRQRRADAAGGSCSTRSGRCAPSSCPPPPTWRSGRRRRRPPRSPCTCASTGPRCVEARDGRRRARARRRAVRAGRRRVEAALPAPGPVVTPRRRAGGAGRALHRARRAERPAQSTSSRSSILTAASARTASTGRSTSPPATAAASGWSSRPARARPSGSAATRRSPLVRTVQGDASLVIRSARATITAARWSEDGDLDVEGVARLPGGGAAELLLVAGIDLAQRAFPVDIDRATGRFAARLTPARIPTLAGVLPIGRGRWEVALRRAGAEDRGTPVMLDEGLYEQLPLTTVVNHKPFNLGVTDGGHALLIVERDHEPDERGPYHQRRLRETVYAARRTSRCATPSCTRASAAGSTRTTRARSTTSWSGAAWRSSTSGWCATACTGCPTARPLCARAAASTYEALATARFVVDNDHFPEWFTRRADQVCLQTWHGTPLKRLGFDVSEIQGTARSFGRNWDEQVDNWQYVLSPNRFSTPILRKAYAIHGEMLETGYPRNDVLAGADREAAHARAAHAPRSAGGQTGGALRAHVSRPRHRQPRPLPARPAPRHRGAAPRGGRRHDRPVPQAPLHRRRRADHLRRLRTRRVLVSGRHRADARRRRPGHRLLVDDVRLRQHRAARCSSSPTTSTPTRRRSAASTSTSRPSRPAPCCAPPPSSPRRCAISTGMRAEYARALPRVP